VASGPSAPLRVNPSKLRVNEWGERNSRREADPSAAVGLGDDTEWGKASVGLKSSLRKPNFG
jgi:hypothetical protein